MKTTYATLASVLVAFAAADTCRLTAYATLADEIDLGGTTIDPEWGFLFQLNDEVPHQKNPRTGNSYPSNYGCPPYPDLYGYAHFDADVNDIGGLGMCLTNVKNDLVLTAGFDCKGLGGKLFKGTTGSTFFGVGNAVNARCTVEWECSPGSAS